MSKEKIIFIYPKLFTFIQTEIKLLSESYEVLHVNQKWTNKYLLPFNFLRQFLFLITNLSKVNKILISFGGYSSYLPSLMGKYFNKKVAIVVHGTDCVSFPEINYGSLRSPIMRWFIHRSYNLADIILPVSKSLVATNNTYYSEQVLQFGYDNHLSDITTPHKVIPNGLIIEDWNPKSITKVYKTFVTVMTNDQVDRKGGRLIIEAAKMMPDCTFYFAGIDSIKNIETPENIILLGRLSPIELMKLYSKTQFYLQLSNFEGFGVAICEAMLCQCVPIVSDVNFLPSIIEDTGFILKKRNKEMLVELIKSSLDSDLTKLSFSARKRIIDHFSVQNRQKILIKTLKDL